MPKFDSFYPCTHVSRWRLPVCPRISLLFCFKIIYSIGANRKKIWKKFCNAWSCYDLPIKPQNGQLVHVSRWRLPVCPRISLFFSKNIIYSIGTKRKKIWKKFSNARLCPNSPIFVIILNFRPNFVSSFARKLFGVIALLPKIWERKAYYKTGQLQIDSAASSSICSRFFFVRAISSSDFSSFQANELPLYGRPIKLWNIFHVPSYKAAYLRAQSLDFF